MSCRVYETPSTKQFLTLPPRSFVYRYAPRNPAHCLHRSPLDIPSADFRLRAVVIRDEHLGWRSDPRSSIAYVFLASRYLRRHQKRLSRQSGHYRMSVSRSTTLLPLTDTNRTGMADRRRVNGCVASKVRKRTGSKWPRCPAHLGSPTLRWQGQEAHEG